MRKILLSLATLLLTLGVNAQVASFQRTNVKLEKAPFAFKSAAKAPAKIATLESNQRVIGPYTSDAYETNGLGLISLPGTYPTAAYMEEGFQDFSGTKLVKIRFALAQAAKVNNVFLYAMANNGSTTVIAKQNFTGSTKVGWNEVVLDNPVTLDFTNVPAILLGFEYVQTSSERDGYPLSMVLEDMICPTLIYGNLGSGEGWYNVGTESYGSLSVQAIVESDDFSENAISPKDFGSVNVLAGANRDVDIAFTNLGAGVTSFDYTIAYDGVAGEEKHLDLATPINTVGGSFIAKVPFYGPATTGVHEAVLTVTKVNGVENGAKDNTAQGKVLALAKELPKSIAVEEYTGTGCGWCPRGLVGMGKMREAYGNQFVGIAIHQFNNSDPMFNSNYGNLGFDGAPSCFINRKIEVDPYYGSGTDILLDLAEEMKILPEIGVTVSGTWNEDKTKVEATATIEPLVSGQYDIVYALIADDLSGTTNAWKQGNYYSSAYASQTGITADVLPKDLQFLCRLDASYAAEFDDVMIGSSYSGTTNKASLGTLTEGQVAVNTYTLSMPTSLALRNVVDKEKVAVCVLIINKENGAVANAAKFYLSDVNGIAEQNANRKNLTEKARYNAAGQQIFAPQKGLNIIQLSDGSVQKIMVR